MSTYDKVYFVSYSIINDVIMSFCIENFKLHSP